MMKGPLFLKSMFFPRPKIPEQAHTAQLDLTDCTCMLSELTPLTNLLGVFFPEVSDIHVIFIYWWQIQERERE